MLANHLGYPFYSVGDLRGKMAIERGMTIDELNRVGENDASTDTSVDDYQRELGKKETDFVIEGRLSWHFIPHSFKVMLLCDIPVAAQRIFEARKRENEGREDEPVYASAAEAEQAIKDRMASDVLRYQKHYGIDYRDPSHYDLVVDTTGILGVENVTALVEKAVRERLETK